MVSWSHHIPKASVEKKKSEAAHRIKVAKTAWGHLSWCSDLQLKPLPYQPNQKQPMRPVGVSIFTRLIMICSIFVTLWVFRPLSSASMGHHKLNRMDRTLLAEEQYRQQDLQRTGVLLGAPGLTTRSKDATRNKGIAIRKVLL